MKGQESIHMPADAISCGGSVPGQLLEQKACCTTENPMAGFGRFGEWPRKNDGNSPIEQSAFAPHGTHKFAHVGLVTAQSARLANNGVLR